MLLLTLSAVAGSPCELSLETAMVPLADALEAGDRGQADLQLRGLEEVFGDCDSTVSAEVLQRWWVLEARTRVDDPEAALDAMVAALRLGPVPTDSSWSEASLALHAQARSLGPASAELLVTPEPGTHRVWLDGSARGSDSRYSVRAGLHAVQLEDVSGMAQWSRLVYLPEGVRTVVETGVAPGTDLPGRRRSRVLTWAGVGALVAGGASLAASFPLGARMKDAPDGADLRQRYRVHAATRGAGVGLLAVGGISISVDLARRGKRRASR